ncbi:TcaA NTF2-like domain-containing protein [Ureibacillus massiliensis]|uniref:TcaA NTF2-like domain-containing protein n=1 Tax=Ureibacillus massiliensis TaxID=292806 RepID=UPI0038B5DE3A
MFLQKVTDVVDLGNGSFEVTTVEEFIIYYPDNEQYKTFSTVCEVQNSNGRFKVDKLISTTEI